MASPEELTATALQSASIEEVAGSSDNLSQLSQELQETIAKFKL
ncbi:hypothetical protein [Vallitalea okinawensis]|nr:hypothetical protein [Vallitalea okinawensis]